MLMRLTAFGCHFTRRWKIILFLLAAEFPAVIVLAQSPGDDEQFSVTFTSTGNCANTPVSFFATTIPGADSLHWSFGDDEESNAWAPMHKYRQGGNFEVTLVAYLNGASAQTSQAIGIYQSDLELSLVRDTTACMCELPYNEALCPEITPFEVSVGVRGGTTPAFQWYGIGGMLPETTATLQPYSPGYYYVVATDGLCSTYAGVIVKPYDSLDKRENVWYFGQGAGIDFNVAGQPPASINGPVVTSGGSSVISNREGQVILSTDGKNVFDRSLQNVTPPGGLAGDNGSSQSSLIIPVPGDETLYYIFTTGPASADGGSEIRYSLFDMKLNYGYGDFVSRNVLLFANSTGRVTGSSEWLVTHEFGNNLFRAYRITMDGIGRPVISSVGSDHSENTNPNSAGYMKLAESTLAVAVSEPGVLNHVEVFDFDTYSGQVSNVRIADLNVTSGHINGVEVISNGVKVFATWTDGGLSKVYEFATHVPYRYHFLQSVAFAKELGAIQRAPDGQIYVAINGAGVLGTFVALEDTAVHSNLAAMQSFALAPGTTSGLGLPNTILRTPPSPDFFAMGNCLGQQAMFYAAGKDPAIDKFDWIFGDGASEIGAGPIINHTYQSPGAYTVVLKIRNKCESPSTTVVETLLITNGPSDPSTSIALCTGAVQLDANPDDIDGLEFLWSTSGNTETVFVDEGGIYGVTITDENGCSIDASFFVADSRPMPELGEDLSVCVQSEIQKLNAMNPGASYAWSVNGQANGNHSQLQNVDASLPGIYRYSVQVTDPLTACFGRDSVTFNIHALPEFTLESNGPIICDTETGQITITGPDHPFDYLVAGPAGTISGSVEDAQSLVATSSTLPTGTYTITLTDQHGCEETHSVAISGERSPPIISSQEGLLISSYDAGNQWFLNGAQIIGATGNSYMPTASGAYSVQVTSGSCSALSQTTAVTITGAERNYYFGVRIYPNPSQGIVTIELDQYSPGAKAEVLTIEGTIIQSVQLDARGETMIGQLNLSPYASGIYLVRICSRAGVSVSKIVCR